MRAKLGVIGESEKMEDHCLDLRGLLSGIINVDVTKYDNQFYWAWISRLVGHGISVYSTCQHR